MSGRRAIIPLGVLGVLVCLATAASGTPYFCLETESQWLDALNPPTPPACITPVEPLAWDDYMMQWDAFLEEGDPYPDNVYVTPELYVWGGGGSGGTNPEDAGLVMRWDAPPSTAVTYSAAWQYDYQLDPNLSNSTITVTVTAPQFTPGPPPSQVNVVSFGIQDINGNIRSWHWKCGPGWPIQWNVPTQITINTAVVGLAAANPPASGYMSNPGFDITQAQFFIVDENATWVGGPGAIPPPGQVQPGIWNYWHNILVTPGLPQKGTDPIKWSQPPVEYMPGHQPPIFLGWDQRSGYYSPPIVADDWRCDTDDPVTDIHWWGSFIGWDGPDPPELPIAFHIGIWTDVPDNPSNPDDFSHPGQMIWEHWCDSYQWNFAGYDHDPRTSNPEQYTESCFQFVQYLPEDHWFYQQEYGGPGTIFWLSIAAIYNPDQPPQYPWGWKTRPHFFMDDAVRIGGVVDPSGTSIWPPFVGCQWAGGSPIQFQGETWDVAFELTTRKSEQPYNDLGDAPDSTNNLGAVMTAYPKGGPLGVQANYPTAYQGGLVPCGPIHLNPKAVAYLGPAVTLENEADIGPDQDGVNNIDPVNDAPDRDAADDGVIFPLVLPHCQASSFQYQVNVVIPNQTLYVNVWFDWDRDGDWDDTMQCPGGPAPVNAPEWAVQNQALNYAAPGLYVVTTPQFIPWHPNAIPDPIWMRITLSDQPWQQTPGIAGDGGSGPTAGYTFGETEDYYFTPELPHGDLDWGDAPDPNYPTLSASNGANHVIVPGFCLGNWIDAEPDGQPDPNALGDDNNPPPGPDDEDGVTFNSAMFSGVPNTITVTATIPAGTIAYLNAWLDHDGNGSWADPGDQVLVDRGIGNGTNSYTFIPGPITAAGSTFMRFRLCTQRGLTEVGWAPDGEVEDYEVKVVPVKWLQRPDLSTTGVDVNNMRVELADDFKCTQSGPITDIHIWTSFYHNYWPTDGFNSIPFTLSLYKDVPDPNPQDPADWSHPGELLWSMDFAPYTYDAHVCANVQGEWWHDPLQNSWIFPGDTQVYQYDFYIDAANAYVQHEGDIYWLGVKYHEVTGDEWQLGWKSSLEQWNDDACWLDPRPAVPTWMELRYGDGHPMVEDSMDLAFAITSEPLQVGTLKIEKNHDVPDHFWWHADPDPDNEMASIVGSADAVEGIFWNNITLQASGTGNDALDIAAVNVWADNDNDGKVSAGDVNLGSGVYPVDNGAVTINLVPAPLIPAGGTYPVVISYTMAAAAAGGSTYQFDVVGASGTGQTSGLPVIVVINPNPLPSAKKIVGPTPISIGTAKKRPPPVVVLLDGKICTANFQANMSLIYIEEPDRSAGIGILTNVIPIPAVAMWDRVSVLGTRVLTNSSELVVSPQAIIVTPGIAPPLGSPRFPLGMNNKWTGGGRFGTQPGVYDDAWAATPAYGLSNVGMAITTWGKVTYHESAFPWRPFPLPPFNPAIPAGDMFWIDDGSGLKDGFLDAAGGQTIGVACWLPAPYGAGLPSPGEYWGVTGILRAIPSPWGWPGIVEPVRLLVPRIPGDLIRYRP